ncbi:hypothetical protein OOJ91_20430 [Micromonospora lupini]|uniref:hypothetical protein n=1 Tax=Micromonospora lupini TaxID=285679 RepID=UPI00224E6FB8|nr:hypothetical protein [Micromonospora lupini]MCX5068211.1 hypothetical protein [Micromonospora lupini]
MEVTKVTKVSDSWGCMLSTHRYLWNERDESVRQNLTFAEQAALSRRTLAGESDAEPPRSVEIASTEALVAASLLREMSARLRHGVTTDAVSTDAVELADVADELVARLYAATGMRG